MASFSHGAIRWLSTDTATTTYTVSGLSFQPKAIRFYWTGIDSATDATSGTTGSRRGIGFASSTSSRRCTGSFSNYNTAAADCDTIACNDCVVVTTTGAGAVDGKLDLNSITSDGFTLIVDDQVPASLTVFWEAWGGDDITNVTIGDFVEPAATGNQSYTATGFVTSPAISDQVVMFSGVQSSSAINTGLAGDSSLSIGFTTGTSSSNNVVLAGTSDDGSTTMDTDGYNYTGDCLAMFTVAGGNPNARATLSAWATDQFTINWTARAVTSRKNIYMAIKGGYWAAGSTTINANTGSATATVSGLAFPPTGMSLLGAGKAISTAGTATANDLIALGSGSSTSSRRSQGMLDENGTANAEINHTIDYDSVLSYPTNGGALDTAIDINAMNSDGFQLIVDTAGGVASEWIGYLTFGNEATLDLTETAFYEDGAETSSTVIDSGANSITRDVSSGDSNIQLRVRLQNSGGAGASTDDYQLQYELNDSGMWGNSGDYPIGLEQNQSNSLSFVLNGDGGVGEKLGQGFTGLGSDFSLKVADLYLIKVGTPTDDLTLSVYTGAFDGTLVGASDTIAASSVGTSSSYIRFTFSTPITITASTKHYLVLSRSVRDTSNYIQWSHNNPSVYASNGASQSNSGTWNAEGVLDFRFILYTEPLAVLNYNSASLTDGNATTNRLGSGSGSFVAGEISEDGLVDDLQITASNYTELLYSLTIDSDAVADADTLDFRVLRNGATTGMTYTVTPRITIEKSTGATLVTQDISQSFSIDNATITQNHILANQDISHSLSLDNATITQNHILVPDDISHSFTLDTTTIAETHLLSPADIQHGLTIDTTTITQNHVITPDDIAFSFTEDNGTISQNHILVTQDIQQGLTVDNATITQNHILVTQDVSHSLTLDNTTLTQNHVLATQDISQGLTLDATTISQNHIIATQDIEHGLTLDATTVSEDSVNYTIVTADIELGLTVDNATITQNHILTPDDLAFNITEDNGTVTETNFNLVTQDISHGLTVDTTTISQNHVISTQDISHSFTLDNTTLSQNHIIVTQDLSHGLTLDSTTLTQNHVLVPDDIAFSITEDNGSISQNHIIATQDLELGLTLDNTTIDLSVLLPTQDISHSLTLDNTSITQNHVITPDDIAFSITEDNGSISQNHVLVTQDIQLGLTTDNTSISQNHVISTNDLSHSLTVDTTTLTQLHIITVDDISFGITEDNGTINQVHILTPQDLELATQLDNTTVEASATNYDITPNGVTFGTAPRKYWIDTSGRIFWVISQELGILEEV